MEKFSGRAVDKELTKLRRSFTETYKKLADLSIREDLYKEIQEKLEAAYSSKQKEIVIAQFEPKVQPPAGNIPVEEIPAIPEVNQLPE